MPSVQLLNAAEVDTYMPYSGLGTFGYNHGGNPEHWNDTVGFNTVFEWYSVGGRRWDSAYSYESVGGVAKGLLNLTENWTKIDRKEIWITQKIGYGGNELGYNDTISQFEKLLDMFNTTYFDLLLIHWPSLPNNRTSNDSSTPYCNAVDPSFNPSFCRQITWRAMEKIFNGYNYNGNVVKVRAIGVSNFEKKHLMDIFNLNSLLPSVNQIEFHPYWSEFELVEYCQSYNILINSYSPLGVPDVVIGEWKYTLLQHPTILSIAQKYNKSPAQIILNWQYKQNIVFNPRSENTTHMMQNLNVFDFQLNQQEMQILASLSDKPPYPNNKICPDPNTCP